MSVQMATKRLLQEQKQLLKNPPPLIAAAPTGSNLFHWTAYIQGPPSTPFEFGLFRSTLTFPSDYPLSPPVMVIHNILHPNVYPDGTVCISILHTPGADPTGYEHASERWSPVQSVEKILVSVLSMLSEPNVESPADVEASKLYRENYAEFCKRVDVLVRESIGL